MSTKTKKRAPAKKAAKHASTAHFAGSKVGPHEPIIAKTATPKLSRKAQTIVVSMVKDPGLRQAVLDGLKTSETQFLNNLGIKPGSYLKGQKLNAHEALFAFCGWLTTRDRPIILSSHHNVPPLIELIAAFAKHHHLPAVREDYQDGIVLMKDVLTEVTNDPALNPNQVAPPPPSFEEAYRQITGLFRFFHDQRQNHLLARLLEDLREGRAAEFHTLTDNLERQTERHTQLAEATKELDQVLSGNFTIVRV